MSIISTNGIIDFFSIAEFAVLICHRLENQDLFFFYIFLKIGTFRHFPIAGQWLDLTDLKLAKTGRSLCCIHVIWEKVTSLKVQKHFRHSHVQVINTNLEGMYWTQVLWSASMSAIRKIVSFGIKVQRKQRIYFCWIRIETQVNVSLLHVMDTLKATVFQ